MTQGLDFNIADGPKIGISNGNLIVARAKAKEPDASKPVAYVFSITDAAAGKANVANFVYKKADLGTSRVIPVVQYGDSVG